MLLQQISCETAAQCEQLASTQQEFVLGGIVAVTLLVVLYTAVWRWRDIPA